MEFEQLAADVQCLVACSLPCQALELCFSQPMLLWVKLAAALAPLGPTIIHLCISAQCNNPEPSADASLLAEAFPGVQHVFFVTTQILPDTSDFVLHCRSLMHIKLVTNTEPSSAWMRDMLMACALASAAAHPQGPLRVQMPRMREATLQATRQLWVKLAARVAAPASAVVADWQGSDLLDDGLSEGAEEFYLH